MRNEVCFAQAVPEHVEGTPKRGAQSVLVSAELCGGVVAVEGRGAQQQRGCGAVRPPPPRRITRTSCSAHSLTACGSKPPFPSHISHHSHSGTAAPSPSGSGRRST